MITALDGTPAGMLTLSVIQEWLEKPVPYELTIRRGEETVKTTLTPRRLI